MGLKAGAIGPVTDVIIPTLKVSSAAVPSLMKEPVRRMNESTNTMKQLTDKHLTFFISPSF
jgi:hypothetical protein